MSSSTFLDRRRRRRARNLNLDTLVSTVIHWVMVVAKMLRELYQNAENVLGYGGDRSLAMAENTGDDGVLEI